jgi:molybdate transport repressor ModE-like protein
MIESLTLDQLRVFASVAETGSFSAAARRLGRVQSAVSQAINTLEHILQVPLFDRSGKTPVLNGAGAVLLKDARRLIDNANELKSRAASISADVEPELTLAIDATFPNDLLMSSLRALRGEFPLLPVTVFTEGLGGAEQRLRDGLVRFAIYPMAATCARDLTAEFLTEIAMAPVVAVDHPLAREPAPIRRATLEPHVQLVLTDRTPLTQQSLGVISHHVWRFADLATRLEFLLAGFGWCNMPVHMVAGHIAAGRLKRLDIAERDPIRFQVHVVHERGREMGRAGRWLIDDLRRRLDGPLCREQRRRSERVGLLDPAASEVEAALGEATLGEEALSEEALAPAPAPDEHRRTAERAAYVRLER